MHDDLLLVSCNWTESRGGKVSRKGGRNHTVVILRDTFRGEGITHLIAARFLPGGRKSGGKESHATPAFGYVNRKVTGVESDHGGRRDALFRPATSAHARTETRIQKSIRNRHKIDASLNFEHETAGGLILSPISTCLFRLQYQGIVSEN